MDVRLRNRGGGGEADDDLFEPDQGVGLIAYWAFASPTCRSDAAPNRKARI